MALKGFLKIGNKKFEVDFDHPLDISLPLSSGNIGVNCFGAPPVEMLPVQDGDFIGSTEAGSSVNFFTIQLTPHGNGTHTECVGHITTSPLTIHKSLRHFHFPAKLVSIEPIKQIDGDEVILKSQLSQYLEPGEVEALIIRTLPNVANKKSKNYTGTNPPYFQREAVEFIVNCGIRHLLIDLPSIDREMDEGELASHRAFWILPGHNLFTSIEEMESQRIRLDSTITELIFVDNLIPDGFYLLNLQIVSLELDASPSKPVLYALHQI